MSRALSPSISIDDVVDRRLVRSVFQPIVDLDSGAVVGFEGLSRGPLGTDLETPDRLFGAAAQAGRLGELDGICFDTAVREGSAALDSGLLFVNVEPATLTSELVRRIGERQRTAHLQVVLEVTERAITQTPATLIDGVASARERGWRVALDDVGAEPGSLALLPILRPDVVKLDMALVRDRPDLDLGRTMAAVLAYAERTGATVLAEGVETDEHLERALALGAELAQGYRFGVPGPITGACSTAGVARLRTADRSSLVALSPFDAAVAAGRRCRVARKQVLLQISHQLEEQAAADHGHPLLMSAFQSVDHFTPATAVRYERLAGRCSLVAAFGVGMPPAPAPGTRGVAVLPGDPLDGEWSVVVVGPHYHGALLAKDLGDTGCAEADRRFSYVVTHDRTLVETAAESLLRRLHAPDS